jgi:hypothetical protein
VEEEVFGLGEGDGLAVEEGEGSGGADFGEVVFDLSGVYGVGGFAEETKEDGAVGGVADAGEGERAVEVYFESAGLVEEAGCGEILGEPEGGSHRADGVRTGWADADLEEFEEAGVHELIVEAREDESAEDMPAGLCED